MVLLFVFLTVSFPSEMYSTYCSAEVVDSLYHEFSIQAEEEYGADASVGTEYLMADWAYGVSLLDLADHCLDKALGSEISDEVLRADCLSLASAVARLKGDLISAIDYAEECLEIDRNSNVKENISSSLNNIAGLYMTHGDAPTARKYIDEAILIEKSLDRNSYLAIRYGVAAEIYLHLGLHEEALSYAEKAFELDSLDNRTGKIAVRRSQMAEVLMEMGRDGDALIHLSAAVPVFKTQNNLNSLAISLAQQGEIYSRAGNRAMAEDSFMKCVEVCQNNGNIYIESRGRNGLWQLLRDSDPQTALVHLERYVQLQKELNNDKAAEQLQAFNVKYDTLKKEQTILMQKQKLIWSGVLSAMLLFLLILSILIMVLKVRAARAVEQKNALLVKANIDKERLLALSRMNIPKEVSTELENIAAGSMSLPEIHLTARELQIAELCATGMINKEIASRLGISQRTVEVHKNNIFKKLGINNTVELMRYMQMRFAEEQK